MTIKLYEKYAPRATAGNASYPFGSIKNESLPGANDGTPLEQAWGNDIEGFKQAALAASGIVPDGMPDTAQQSQIWQAIQMGTTPFVRPEWYGAKMDGTTDDTAAFTIALSKGKTLLLSAGTYRANIVLTDHFDIRGSGMNRTVIKAFDKTKPAIKNMFQEPKWAYPEIRDLRLEGAGTREGVGFSFGDFTTYNTGDENIGRVRMTNVYINNFDKNILKCYGNIGNIFDNVSTYGANYHYYARGAKFGNPAAGIMHAGADLFIGGQVTGVQKMCFLVLDTTPGSGQWTFLNTVLQFNPGGTFMWDVSGTSQTAWQSVNFTNIWLEGNATAASVTIDGLSGPRTITPSGKFTQTSYGPDYCNWGKTVQHGTVSTLGRVNVWGNERIALNLEGGGIGSGDYVDLAFSSAAFPTTAGAWLRSTRGSSLGRNLAIHTATGMSAEFNIDGGSTIGVAANTPSVTTTANKFQANVTVGGTVAAFVGPFSSVTKINMPNNQNYSATLAGMHLGSVDSTLRSLNASGTINASGADYAEYMVKTAGCGEIQKGALCGVNANGQLTDKFDGAVSFVVKSTDPAYVGGDNWGGVPAPEQFTGQYAKWVSDVQALTAAQPVQMADEDTDDFTKRATQWSADLEKLQSQEPAQRESDEWVAWAADLEKRRQRVDRIAFAGQVPCNVTGAKAGDYIVPVRTSSGGITGTAVTKPTFEQYAQAVGKVWKVMDDGRAWVAVKIG